MDSFRSRKPLITWLVWCIFGTTWYHIYERRSCHLNRKPGHFRREISISNFACWVKYQKPPFLRFETQEIMLGLGMLKAGGALHRGSPRWRWTVLATVEVRSSSASVGEGAACRRSTGIVRPWVCSCCPRNGKPYFGGFHKWGHPIMDGLWWKILNGWFGGTPILGNHHFHPMVYDVIAENMTFPFLMMTINFCLLVSSLEGNSTLWQAIMRLLGLVLSSFDKAMFGHLYHPKFQVLCFTVENRRCCFRWFPSSQKSTTRRSCSQHDSGGFKFHFFLGSRCRRILVSTSLLRDFVGKERTWGIWWVISSDSLGSLNRSLVFTSTCDQWRLWYLLIQTFKDAGYDDASMETRWEVEVDLAVIFSHLQYHNYTNNI